ncbi:MAG: hypothetical protein KDD29_03830 [Flavobacteriales bacterium]|nr:hypothetical protein [Flavobacteriales bacterium]MCB9335782.1 hypothetical protein [Flavobacteriales bacterium]
MNICLHKNKLVPVIIAGSFLFIASLFSTNLKAQQKQEQIEILNANTLEYDESLGTKAKRLIGDVQFKHKDALMYCDSAYFYSESNTMDAYGHVKITQGDSLQLFGDSLFYSGVTQKALLRSNIRLINKDVTLTTSYLDYDRTQNMAYYYSGGKVVSAKENTTLTSQLGYYYADSKSFFFKNDVVLVHPDYKIESDTLQYASNSKIVTFLGPTTITSKNDFIYCENGWYNTNSNVSKFFKNSYLYSDNKIITGDTLYYERETGYGNIRCNGAINDTVQDIILQGDLIYLFQQKDSVMITKEALMMQLFEKDTLFLHADSFFVSTRFLKNDSLPNQTDTIRNLLAYHGVKFFKSDMQGKADSLVYNFSDSTVNFYHDPIIWSKENQLTALFIYLQMKDGKIDAIYLNDEAFIISKADSLFEHFNQISGDKIIGYFKDRSLHKIRVLENAKTIYYARDDEGKYIGVNKAEGNDMLIFLEDNQLSSLTFIKDPEAILYPIKEPSPKDVTLKGFNWRIKERPNNRFDIFTR